MNSIIDWRHRSAEDDEKGFPKRGGMYHGPN